MRNDKTLWDEFVLFNSGSAMGLLSYWFGHLWIPIVFLLITLVWTYLRIRKSKDRR